MERTPDILPVSSGQKRLFILSRLEGGEAPYHLTAAYRLRGEVDSARLRWALEELVRRHESLRTGFDVIDDDIRQVIYPEVDAAVQVVEDRERPDEEWIRRNARPFDLVAPPLLHATIVVRSEHETLLALDAHHIAVDGISWNLLIQDLIALYSSGSVDTPAPRYRDFASRQQAWLESDEAAGELAFWREQFADGVPTLSLPTDRPRPPRQDFSGALHRFEFPSGLAEAARTSAREQGVTLNMLLFAAWSILLHRLSGQEDLVVGFPTSGRWDEQDANTVGMLAGTSLVRLRPTSDTLVRDWLAEVRGRLLAAYAHSNYPFEELVEQIKVPRDQSRNPLFDTTFVYERADDRTLALPGIEVDTVDVDKGTAMFDIALEVTDHAGILDGCFEYSTTLFDEATILRWSDAWIRVLTAIVDTPDVQLGDIPLFSEDDRDELTRGLNAQTTEHTWGGTVLDRFLAHAEEHPDRTALVMQGAGIPYSELRKRAEACAAVLRDHGVERGDVVALVLERSPAMIASLLGAMLCGAAYLPIDPSQPDARLEQILEDSGCRVVVTSPKLAGRVPELEGTAVLHADSFGDGLASYAPSLPDPRDIAYVIYTSGTTGRPKGCPISHANLMNYIGWASETYASDDTPVHFPLYTSIAFDLTVTSIFGSLTTGGTLTLFPDGEDAGETLRAIFDPASGITTVKMTPAHATLLRELNLRSTTVQTVILGGEQVRREHLATLWSIGPLLRIFNEYGPTETTVGCTVQELRPDDPTITIGRPIANTRVYVLDDRGRLVPRGVAGELVVAGKGVFPGYLRAAERNVRAFVNLPFDPEGRGYRTGDLGRWRNDGTLECLGRSDDQLKVHGYRVEPGEIEAALLGYPGVDAAVVGLDRAEPPDTTGELTAWLEAREALSLEALRAHLARSLPEYMIPARFLRVERIPLTVNGKVDRALLAAGGADELASSREKIAPSTAMETRIAEVWREVLKRDEIGIHDNYFLLGGDSIKAIQIVSRLARKQVTIRVRDLFDHPTIAELAVAMAGSRTEVDQGPAHGPVPLSPVQAFFFEKHPFHRAHFTQAVLLSSRERLDAGLLERTLMLLQDHHDALRMRYQFKGGAVQQVNAGHNYPLALEIHDLRDTTDADSAADAVMEVLPARVDLTEGPLLRGALLQLPDRDQLFLVAHHLVIDGVSWRILLEDLDEIYRQLLLGDIPHLPPRTHSFQACARFQHQLASSDRLDGERTYWETVLATPDPPLPGTDLSSGNRHRDLEVISHRLSRETTQQLLEAVQMDPGTGMRELLLASLGRVLAAWRGVPSLVDLEGHGRDGWLEELDPSRTVGWFTTLYPIVLDSAPTMDETITLVRKTLDRTPARGSGYGILRWLAKAPELGHTPRISFNYLGEFDPPSAEGTFTWELRPLGNTVGPDYPRWHELDFESWIANGCLEIHLLLDRLALDVEQGARLADAILAELTGYLDQEPSSKRGGLELTDAEWAAIQMQTGVEKEDIDEVLPLTPQQEGLLFHAVKDGTTNAYREQFLIGFEGPFSLARFEEAWQQLHDRHSMLRTRFVHKDLPHPRQVVLREVSADVEMLDLSETSPSGRERIIRDTLAEVRASSLDLAGQPGLRTTVIRESATRHHLLVDFHHILLDGWSMGILFGELMALLRGSDGSLPPAPPFASFVRWLQTFDREAAREYWRSTLETVASVPQLVGPSNDVSGQRIERMEFDLEDDETRRLQETAAAANATLSSAVRLAWAALLGAETSREDVLFGAVTSGRPVSLIGADATLGLFLNTLPAHVKLEQHTTLRAALSTLQQQALASEQHQYLSLADIQQASGLRGELFDHIIAFENYPLEPEAFGGDDEHGLRVDSVQSVEQTHYGFSIEVYPGDRLGFAFLYDPARMTLDCITTLRDKLLGALRWLGGHRAATVGDLMETLRDEGERREEEDYLKSALDIGDDF